jgi:hypothetical protein
MPKIDCPACGSDDNREGDGFCGNCGARLSQLSPVSPPVAPGKPENPVSGGGEPSGAKIKCPGCGCESNQADDVFCGGCGVKLGRPSLVGQGAGVQTVLGVPGMAKLLVKKDDRVEREFVLRQEVMNLGRWDASTGVFPEVDLSQEDPGTVVSRKHARITFSQGEYLLEDVGSLNGTYVNKGPRLRLGSPQKLQNGDEIVIGKTLLTFVLPQTGDAAR